MLDSTILDGERQHVRLGEGEAHIWLERDCCFAERALYEEGRWGLREGDIGWDWDGLLANV